jgi:predicted acetylornithine/succinylornithine family transaminase
MTDTATPRAASRRPAPSRRPAAGAPNAPSGAAPGAAARAGPARPPFDAEARHLFPTYARTPVRFVGGRGCRLRDDAGRDYLDMLGGIAVNALGHAHPRIVAALREAARDEALLLHCSNLYYHPWQGALAERLADLFALPRVFFCNSGSESVEAALKLARAHARRTRCAHATGIVALEGSFHGRTAFALSVTGQSRYRAPFGPLLEDVVFVPAGDPRALERAVGPSTAAVILEPVQGEGGVRPLDPAVIHAARAACDAAGALLIADEVQCGLGRTGAWSACRQAGVMPDLVALAKPLAAGLPLGALLGRDDLAADFGPGAHGSTFGGGPLPCRLALAFLDAVEEEGLLANAAARGRQLAEGLAGLALRQPAIREVRGRGLMLGVELEPKAALVVDALRARGVLAGTAGDHVLRLLPPLVIAPGEVEEFLRAFDAALAEAALAEASPAAPAAAAAASPPIDGGRP